MAQEGAVPVAVDPVAQEGAVPVAGTRVVDPVAALLRIPRHGRTPDARP